MSETLTTSSTIPDFGKIPAAPKGSPAAKTPKAKPSNGKAAKTKAVAVAKDRSSADVPTKDRRKALVKLLRKLGATSQTTAKPIKVLAEKLGYTDYDVYCLAYHKYPLATSGIVKTYQVEDVRGLSVYLTAKGQKVTNEQIP